MRRGNIIKIVINAAIFFLLEIAALNMLINNGTLQQTWFAKGSHAFMAWVWGGADEIKNYFSLKKKNDQLALENVALRERVAKLEDIVNDSISLSRITSDGISRGYRYTPAVIKKISSNTQHNYLIIDKGSEDGIVEGCGVITGQGAIGVIDAVSRHFSYARSFMNHEMNVSARLGRTGTVGPLCWNGKRNNGAVLKAIPHHVEFSAGDTVFTSGFSSIFPPDIPLGITGDSKIVNGATHEIEVTLFENLKALRYVTVVKNLGSDEIRELEESR